MNIVTLKRSNVRCVPIKVLGQNVELPVLGATWHTSGLALWGYTSAFSMLLVVIVAPVLGAIADMSRGKKKFLGFCVFVGAIATAAFAYIRFARKVGTRTSILLGLVVYIMVVIYAMQFSTVREFWILGFLALLTVKVGKGRKEAKAFTS